MLHLQNKFGSSKSVPCNICPITCNSAIKLTAHSTQSYYNNLQKSIYQNNLLKIN